VSSINSQKRLFEEIAELIAELYPKARKIIEVGIGKAPWAALRLRMLLPKTEIIGVDSSQDSIEALRKLDLKLYVDDILKPKLNIYEGSDLLYSIRPPLELIDPIALVARMVGADALIAPLSEDAYLYEFKPPWRRIRHEKLLIYALRA